MPAFEWDGSEEKARERRIAERREKVQEHLRRQHLQAKAVGATEAASEHVPLSSKGKQQALRSSGAVSAVLQEATAAAESVVAAAEQEAERHRQQCDCEEAALQEQVTQEAEACRRENQGIDVDWDRLQTISQPQELDASLRGVQARCQRALDSKDTTLEAIRAVLSLRDEQYVKLLQAQSEKTDVLIAALHRQHERLKDAQHVELEAVEAAYLQERGEMMAMQKRELEALLARRSAVEQEFMEQYLAACEQYEEELEKLRAAGAVDHAALRRRLDAELAALELHLDGIRTTHALNIDKLDYNYRVLVERERESKDARLQQKRRITRQWAALNRLRKRYAALDARCAADNARLGDEYTQVARAFNHLQSKFRRFKAADLARFEQVQAMKQEELAELLDELVEAEQLIASDAAGMLVTKAPMAAGQVPVESWKGLEAVGVRVSVLLPQHAQADHASASGHGYGSRGGATAPAQQQGVSLGLWEHAHVGTSSSELATSKLFWQARADAALAPTVVRLWKWLEGQASAQLVALQKRTCTAGEVASLRRDNERLRRALAGLLDSPLRVPAALGC